MRAKIIDWLSRLIAIETTSSKSNLELINLLADWFSQQGIIVNLTYNREKTKANIFATLPSCSGSVNDGIVFSGHTDTVPVTGKNWQTDPFVARQIEDKIFGRGTADMKGFLAVTLALLPELKAQKLSFPIHYAFTFDEEVGCLGVPILLQGVQKIGIKPELCIVGEPSEMDLIIAHKGIQSFRCVVQGLAGHSSLTPFGCNSVVFASKIVNFLHAFAERLQTSGSQDNGYDVPYTTISTNVISGGVTHNVIPDHCEIIFEFRNLPEDEPKKILDEIKDYLVRLEASMQKQYVAAKIVLEKLHSSPSFKSSAELNKLPRMTAKKISYATEAGYFENAGVKTIICGPGSIKQAHQVNEFIAVDQLTKCSVFLQAVVGSFGC